MCNGMKLILSYLIIQKYLLQFKKTYPHLNFPFEKYYTAQKMTAANEQETKLVF